MIRLFRRRKPVYRCRTVWMRTTRTGDDVPWLCDGIEGDGHHCLVFTEGRVRRSPR